MLTAAGERISPAASRAKIPLPGPARVDTTGERTEEAVEDRRAIDGVPQDEALQAYTSRLMNCCERNLRGSEEGSDVRQLAREKTVQVLEGSDPSIKRLV